MTDPQSLEPPPARPQYGQYATPAEQRARIQAPDVTAALDEGVAPAVVAPQTPPPQAAGRRTADRVITIGLLLYGAITVVMTVVTLLDFPAVATASMAMVGIPGEFTNIGQGRLFGSIAAVALVVGWVVTALASWRRLRAGRVSWWVPLVGAVVSFIVVYALLIPPILGDPAFQEYVRATTG